MRCFNCQAYGHFAYECRKPRREQKEVNLSKIQDDEPALLVAEVNNELSAILLKEETVIPKLR